MTLMGLCYNSSGLIVARVSPTIFLLRKSKFAFIINTLPLSLLQCTYSQFLSSVPSSALSPTFGLQTLSQSICSLHFSIHALTNVVVSWHLRRRPLPWGKLLPLMLVQALRIWHPCSDFLLRRCGFRLLWRFPCMGNRGYGRNRRPTWLVLDLLH